MFLGLLRTRAALSTSPLPARYGPGPCGWLWPDRIPAGALTLLAGREGIGKSLIGVHLAAQLTRGTLTGSRYGTPSRVLFATSEDAWEFTMVPRLLAAGADLDRVGRVQVEDDGLITGLTLPVDADGLGAYMTARDVAMLVLDPLTSVMDGRIDAHRDREVRTALEPLCKLAEDAAAAVLGLVHLGKGLGADPVNLILGSRAFSAVARVALVAARDPEDEGSNVLSVEKSNLGRINVPGLTYRIDGAQIMTDEGPAGTGLLVWTGETDRRSATSCPVLTRRRAPPGTLPGTGWPATSPTRAAKRRSPSSSRPAGPTGTPSARCAGQPAARRSPSPPRDSRAAPSGRSPELQVSSGAEWRRQIRSAQSAQRAARQRGSGRGRGRGRARPDLPGMVRIPASTTKRGSQPTGLAPTQQEETS